jgi:hypothetical protein
MKQALVLVALSVFAFAAIQPWQDQQNLSQPIRGWQDGSGLPTLYQIHSITLSPSYSCRSASESQQGYENTAIFLSDYSKSINAPELLFNGACGSPDNFESALAGEYLDVLTDYGDIPLETLRSDQVFSPQRVVGTDSRFTRTVGVTAGHTYGVLINKDNARGFFYFRVLNHVQNQRVDLQYAVMDYQLNQTYVRSPGFDWNATPHN